MLLTRLHRTRDYTATLKEPPHGTLPPTVFGLMRLVFSQAPIYFATALTISCLTTLSMLGIPYATKHIIDAMATAPNDIDKLNYIWPSFAALMGFLLLRISLQQLTFFMSYHWRPNLRRLNYMINCYVTGHSPHYFESELSGKIIQKAHTLQSGAKSINDTILWNWTPTFCYFLAIIFLLSQVNIWLGIGGFIWFVIMLSMGVFVGTDIRKNARVVNEARSQLTGRLADVITNIRAVLHFSNQTIEKHAYAVRENTAINTELKWYLAVLNIRSLSQVMIIIAMVGVMGTSVHLWAHGMATAGDIALCSTLIILVAQRSVDLIDHIPDVLDNIGTMQDSLNTLVKPRTLTDAPNAPTLAVSKGEITFTNVTFAYPDGAPVYTNFNLTIKAGERVGVVGVSGAGKSTLIAMLLRMYDVQGGAITIDGQNIAAVTQESLRRAISFIPQDTLLFHRTIRENIAYGKLDATDAEIEEAARKAQAHDFIMALPNGYNTMVGERGVKLSGGQRQRVAIARALLKNAPILILDEATSALDSEAESEIQAAIKTAMAGKTVIAIAHRLSTIASLDRLIVLQDGQIVEQGSHAELIAANGIYAALWQHQSGGFLGVE